MSRLPQPTTDILTQLLEPVGPRMPVEYANQRSTLRTTPEVQDRINEPADRCDEGELTDVERSR